MVQEPSQASPPPPPPYEALLDNFASYEEYLDSWTREEDLRFLPDQETTHRIIELGYLRDGEVLPREEFESRHAAVAAHRHALANPRPKTLLSAGRDLSAHPLLQALAERELPVRRGSLATVVFLRDRNAQGQEVSGFVDLGHRLASDEAGMAAVFALEARLLPQPTDLSYFNWATNRLGSSSTAEFEVVADPALGLAFKSRRDRKLIITDPAAPSPGDYTTRTEVQTGGEYAQAVIFDHVLGRRT